MNKSFTTNVAIFLSLLFCVTTFAGTTGKLTGKVTDAKTKEALIGANVIVAGTTLGAAVDIDGNYFILNIPPGVYQVTASILGYASRNLDNVRISVDQTTRLDIELGESAIEIKDVIVTAQRELVQRDLTSTEQKISGEEISMLPVEDVQSLVNLQAGVVEGHFRGGRTGEVKYLIDGVSVNDVFSGQSTMEAEVNSIQELQVLTGTFNAEYGEALSGVVNQVTKIAGENYNGSLSLYTGDYISGRKTLYPNLNKISPKDVYNLQANLSGPIPVTDNIVKFFLSGRYIKDNGYIYGTRRFNPSDSSNFSANDPNEWYIGATGDSSFVPMNNSTKIVLQGKLAFKVGTGKGIVLNGLYQDDEYRVYNHRFRLNPDGDYKYFQKSILGSISYTHLFSSRIFLDILGSGYYTGYKQYTFENPYDLRYVNPDRMSDVSGNSFLTGGTENWHFKHDTETYTGKLDFTDQVTENHEMKVGVEYNQHKLDYEDFQVLVDATTNFQPSIPAPGTFNFNTYTNHPFQLSGYVQDKIELEYLIVNVGVRFDYFQPDADVLINPDSIAALDEQFPPFEGSLFRKATTKQQVSPRIGISYPISDKGAIHISYGHFFQVPPFEFLYKNPNFRIPLTGELPSNIGNIIGNADLKPQQTIMYEIGLQQELFENFGLNITAYYKDIRNLLGTEVHIKNNFKKFAKFVNRDYGAVSGFTLSFEKRFTEGYGASVDYTYQIAQGNASDPNDAFNKAQANPPIEVNKQLVPLSWDRRHSLNISAFIGDAEDYIISIIGRLGSGLPYTPSLQNQRTGLENSDNRPSFFNVDLYLTKYLNLMGYNLSLFAKVYNLFDTANEQDVYGDTGRAGYTLELTRSQEQPRGVNTLSEYLRRPDFYSAPRQIIVGAQFSF